MATGWRKEKRNRDFSKIVAPMGTHPFKWNKFVPFVLEHAKEYQRLLAEFSNSDLSSISDDDDWPSSPVRRRELFPELCANTESTASDSDEENNGNARRPPEVTSSTEVTRSTAAAQTGPRRNLNTNECHLFRKNINFNHRFTVDVDNHSQGTNSQSTVLSPVDYFMAYLSAEILDALTLETQKKYMSKQGKPLSLTVVHQMKKFIGINFLMSVLRFPRIKMYWQKKTRISCIADAMGRDMFSVIRASLKVFDESLLNAAQRKSDKFHKIRPLIDCVRSRCLELDRPQNVSVDEMIIPFTGRTNLKQFTPRKPNPHGLKIFVLASSDGQVLEFEFFQGKEDLLLSVQRTGLHLPEWDTLKIGEAAVLRFVKSVNRGTSFFFDRFFTTPKLLEILSSLGMGATGTMKKNLVPRQCRLKTENQLKRSGRGSSDCAVRDDSAFCITVWFDKKPIILASNEHSIQPVSTCQRWCKKEKRHLEVQRPRVVELYNSKMGGVDIIDQVISYYRSATRSAKFTVRAMLHLLDLSCANAWLEYRKDCEKTIL
ncbi:piggyBac transposable element-derived protein 3-like [Penaeus indicus]|uniref:piggyBac transposable element-derived protein 3-like n=1 Tax=Penaeus indicus TaxID=29960 RepID=UPI00300CB2E1